MRSPTVVRGLLCVAAAMAAPACDAPRAPGPTPAPPVAPEPPPPAPEAHDAGVSRADAGAHGAPSAPRCPRRGLPPDDLSADPPREPAAALAWSGREWGVVWSEDVGSEPAVFFARVGRDGRRLGSPARVSERSYRGTNPAVVWNGESWSVMFSGGASRLEEIWVAHVDVRGAVLGRPQRVTARDRRDLSPALALGARGLLAVWSAVLSDGFSAIMALRTNRWGAQAAPPMLLARRAERLSAPVVVWNGGGWAAAWLVSRTEALAVDMARVDADGNPRGYVSRVTLGPLGGTDLAARFGVAWDGSRYGLAWDEVRDGAPHVFFDTVGVRLDGAGEAVMLSAAGDSARAPALASEAPGVFLAAWEVERGGDRHVQLGAFDASGRALGEPIEIQGNDGTAQAPALALGDDALGVATVSRRGVSFHRVELGPCDFGPGAAPPPNVAPAR